MVESQGGVVWIGGPGAQRGVNGIELREEFFRLFMDKRVVLAAVRGDVIEMEVRLRGPPSEDRCSMLNAALGSPLINTTPRETVLSRRCSQELYQWDEEWLIEVAVAIGIRWGTITIEGLISHVAQLLAVAMARAFNYPWPVCFP
ncbi:MAG: hypothetical protein LBR78_02720 [Holosporales bacterium]|nr:hypothetical protein [Holosporales bacterium]